LKKTGLFPNLTQSQINDKEVRKVLKKDFDVDEIVPRLIGGRQVIENQRLLPRRINRSLGPRLAKAIEKLNVKSGTPVEGIDVEFR